MAVISRQFPGGPSVPRLAGPAVGRRAFLQNAALASPLILAGCAPPVIAISGRLLVTLAIELVSSAVVSVAAHALKGFLDETRKMPEYRPMADSPSLNDDIEAICGRIDQVGANGRVNFYPVEPDDTVAVVVKLGNNTTNKVYDAHFNVENINLVEKSSRLIETLYVTLEPGQTVTERIPFVVSTSALALNACSASVAPNQPRPESGIFDLPVEVVTQDLLVDATSAFLTKLLRGRFS